MKNATLIIACCLLTSNAWAFQNQDNRVPPPPQGAQPAPDGIQVEARGQLHEAYASPYEPRQTPTKIVPKKPPEAVNELPPEQKPDGDNVQWIPGYWMWDEDRTDFLWVSGTWRVMPPDRRWVPGYWMDVEGGYRWVSGYWYSDKETHVTLLPEPPTPVEEAVPELTSSQTYVPGHWVYRSNTYWWQPGFAVNQQPGWLWTPATYWWTPGGYVFTDGYWDYDLNRRGLAFAPVSIDLNFRTRPNWFYRPAYVINTDSFYGSLFVNTGWNHYFFGDYYDAGYTQRGYTPWFSYRVAERQYDPLFNYYRWQHRSNQGWEREIQNIYAGRRDGSILRPSRTFTQNDRSTTNRQVTDVNTITSLNQWRGDQFKLQPLPQGEDRKIVDHYRNMSTERNRNERDTRTSLSPRDNLPGKDGTNERAEGVKNPPLQNKDNNTARKETIPPTKSVLPGSKEGSRAGTTPGSRPDMPERRYELPKTNQAYRPSTTVPAPQRPTHPQPVQNPSGRQGNPPPKNPGKGGSPGKDG